MKTATLDRLHGIALIALMSLSAFYIAGIPEVKALSLSPLIVGIIIGMIYANTLRCRMPKEWEPGIKFCTKRLLRLGIIFYGFRLTLSDVAAVGLPAVTVDIIIVAGTLLLGLLFSRWIKWTATPPCSHRQAAQSAEPQPCSAQSLWCAAKAIRRR